MSQIGQIVHFEKIGNDTIGYLSIAQAQEKVPFRIQRVYWVSDVPKNVKRGGHANVKNQQVLIAVAGTIEVSLTDRSGISQKHVLNNSGEGLVVPNLIWKEIVFQSHQAVLLSISSEEFDEDDYLRDFEKFLTYDK